MKTTSTLTPAQQCHASVMTFMPSRTFLENLDVIVQLIYILQTKHIYDPQESLFIHITTIEILFISIHGRLYRHLCHSMCVEEQICGVHSLFHFCIRPNTGLQISPTKHGYSPSHFSSRT